MLRRYIQVLFFSNRSTSQFGCPKICLTPVKTLHMDFLLSCYFVPYMNYCDYFFGSWYRSTLYSTILSISVSGYYGLVLQLNQLNKFNCSTCLSSTPFVAQNFCFLQNRAYFSEVPLALNFPFSRDNNLFSLSILLKLISQLNAVFCHLLQNSAILVRQSELTASLLIMYACLCVKQNTRSCNENIYSNYRFTGIMSSYCAKIISCSLYSVFLFMHPLFCLAVRQKESRPPWAQRYEDVNTLLSGAFLTYHY